MIRRNSRERLTFLFPLSVIKEKNFTKKDVKYIKDSVNSNLSIVRLIISSAMFVIALLMLFFMNKSTGGDQVSKYGLSSLIALIISLSCNFICMSLLISTFFIKKEPISNVLNRIAVSVLFVGLALQLLLGIYADAEMGFTTEKEAMSASVVIISLLILVQPSYWTEASIFDIGFTFAFLGLSLFCREKFGMMAIHYYILVGILYPICCYFIVALLFYAECQHYKDLMENDRLNDKAYYDNLTKCKNRHALSEFIKENAKNWKSKNLLIILFDIDNFKQYNDQFSHLGGDYCLRSIADAVRTEFASPSLDFFRYGGEEFLLFFELEDKKDAPMIMENVRKAIRNQEIAAPEGAPKDVVTVSLGGILIERAESFKFEDELALVDKYLYIAKANGKDVSCFNGELIEH